MSKESIITLIPALIMLGFAIFGASVAASIASAPSVGH